MITILLVLLVLSIIVLLWIIPKTKDKESTPTVKQFNPDGSEHYCYPNVCETEEAIFNVCNNLIHDNYINFTVYHRINKVINLGYTYPSIIISSSINSIHIYIPK